MWTKELQQQTRELFEKMNGAFMKHYGDSRFGVCVLVDGKYRIMDRVPESNDIWEYDSVDEMIADGWVVD